MSQENSSIVESPTRRFGLLKDQVQLVKKKGTSRYEIAPIQDPVSFEKGFFVVIRTCQLLVQKNEGIVLVGVAGPSGAGKTVFTDKVLNFIPGIAVITMDNYTDATRIVDGNFDDPRLTDYDTLLDNIRELKEGRPVEVPIYDSKSSSRIGYRKVEVPSSRIVIIEGIYALSEKLRPLLDLRVSVTGGVHFDLVKRVLRDIQRLGQEPEEIIHQISETVYPMYKAFIEPDLQTAHIKIINKFNPFSGFQNPSYILKSKRTVTGEQMKAVLSPEHEERREETYDIYLLPPGEDPEACQSYLRMRNRDGKYNLMFEEWVTDSPFIISPRITFEVSVRLLGGLMALGYTIAGILKRTSHVLFDDKVCVKTDWLEQLNRTYVQVQGRDRLYVKCIGEQLGLDGTYVPRTYIEQIQLEKAVNDVMALPDALKTKLSIDDDLVSRSKEALSRASADRRSKYLNRGVGDWFLTRERNLPKLTKLLINSRKFDGRIPDSSVPVANQIKQRNDHKIPLEAIKDCTQEFDEKNIIGNGGYGKVYKGILTWAHHVNELVAVKRLNMTGFQGKKEFHTEVTMLSQYQHENIITLIGFCDDNKEMILVYEYATHGSLDTYLCDSTTSDGPSLSWPQLLNICIGVACALDYLHNHVAEKHRIIHRDIKSSNVLLDENWIAKLSDFGLARIGLANQQNTFVITNLAGTHGYNDPQYERTGFLTKESDVYSLGVVLFEVLCGRLACVYSYHDERRFLHHLARTRYKSGELEEIVDRRIRKDIKARALSKFSAIAYQCLQETREERPRIAEVVFHLKEAMKIQLEDDDDGAD